MFQASFEDAKYLTLGVGVVNLTFTLVAVSFTSFSIQGFIQVTKVGLSLQFFLMEKAGRRKLLLTGFLFISACNLLLTGVDSLLVAPPSARSPLLRS